MNNRTYVDEEGGINYFEGIVKSGNKTRENTERILSGTKMTRSKGFLEEGMKTEIDNSDRISGSLCDFGAAGINYTNNFCQDERAKAKMIDDMPIFKDLLAEDAAQVNYFNGVLLEKIDGRSVKDGQATKKANETDDYDVVKEAVNNINGNVTEQQNLDGSSSIVGQSILENINGNNVSKMQELDNATKKINSVEVRNINENITDKQEVGNETGNINNGVVRNISGKTTNYVDSDVSTSIVGDSILENINGNKAVEKQEFTDMNIAAGVENNEKKEDEDKKMNEPNELNNNSMGEDKKVIA